MSIDDSLNRFVWLREQRCFLLFFALLALLVVTPFLTGTIPGRWTIGILNVLILFSAILAVQRSKLTLVAAILLALPTLACQIIAVESRTPEHLAWSWSFNAAFYTFTIGHLLRYVLRQGPMTADKLYGAVAAYLMIAILAAFLHGLVQYAYPDAYMYQGRATTLELPDLIFFSFTVLTTAGFGDITPHEVHARFLTLLEAVTGVMYVAILIARLTGVYPIVTKS